MPEADTGQPESLAKLPDGPGRLSGPVDSGRPGRSPATPFAGMELPGRVVATFLRGTPTVLDGKLT